MLGIVQMIDGKTRKIRVRWRRARFHSSSSGGYYSSTPLAKSSSSQEVTAAMVSWMFLLMPNVTNR